MGRRMRPLNPEAGPVEQFACELRALRALAGDLPFWKMARRCGVSKSALAAAVAGRTLPSETVTREFVRACGGDWPWWRDRWIGASAAVEAATRDEGRRGGPLVPRRPALPDLRRSMGLGTPGLQGSRLVRGDRPDTGRRPRRSWRRLVWVTAAVAGTVVVTVTVVTAAGPLDRVPYRTTSHASAHPSATPSASQVSDGADPKQAGCASDRVFLAVSPVLLQRDAHLRGRRLAKGTKVGTISLSYSAHCAGAWGRFDPTPGLNPDPNDSTVGTLTVESDRPADNSMSVWKMGHLDNSYAGLLLTGLGCVIARARVDMVGQDVAAVGQTPCLPHL
jgi:hypothetical protein